MGAAELAYEWEDDGAEGSGGLELVKEFGSQHGEGQRREEPGPVGSVEPRAFVYDGVRVGRAMRAGLSRRAAGGRPLPMEDVLLYVKQLPSAQLRRAPDARSAQSLSRMLRLGAMGLLLAIVVFGPRAWLRQSGYRQAELIEQRQELLRIQDHLRVRHAQLGDLRRVGRIAQAEGLTEPSNENYTWQDRTIAPVEDAGRLAKSFEGATP